MNPVDGLYPITRVAALVIFAAAVAFLCFRRTGPTIPVFLNGLLVATVLLLAVAHRFLAIAYPVARTAIYFAPLMLFAIASILRDLKGRLRLVRIPFAALAGVLMVQFVLQLNVSYYNHWPFDAGTRQIARFISARPSSSARTKVTADWTLVPCLNFYREIYNLAEWEPVEGQNGATLESGDYVVFDNANSVALDRLKPVFMDATSGAVVAVHR